MSAINFPDPSQSPWTNTGTGVTYAYINGAWKVTGGTGGGDASITVSDTAPELTTVQEGALWWNSSVGRLFIVYTDPNTSTKSWVEASPDTDTDTTLDLSTLAVLPPAGE